MKERDENIESEEYSVQNMLISNYNIEQYRNILREKNFFSVHLKNMNETYININNESFLKINEMMQSYPEENIVFLYNQQTFYTPRNSLTLSKSSINKGRNSNSSFSSSFKRDRENMKNIREEIINTDIVQPKIDNTNNNNENIIFELDHNQKIDDNKEDQDYINNIKNIQKLNNNSLRGSTQRKEINKNNRKFVIFKWIFHFYLIVGILIFLHYFSFIFSEYNNYFYKWICILLIISLIYVGYIGIKNRISNENYFLLDGDNLFWTNFLIFILTMLNFIALVLAGGHFKFIKEQGIIGYLIVIIYILTLVVEALYVIYYDVIIEEISWEKFNSNNIDEFNKNNLNIQLMDVKNN